MASMRRGTKSCVNCRHSKVRCSWNFEDTPICQRCISKNLPCVAQTPSATTSKRIKLSTDIRVAELESRVDQLSRTVRDIQTTLRQVQGHSSLPTPSQAQTSPRQEIHNSHHEDENYSSDASSTSEAIIEEPSARLNTLFQNEWLSTDSQRNSQLRHSKQQQSVTNLLQDARSALQELIPSESERFLLSPQMSSWLAVVAEVFPSGSSSLSLEEINASYEHMKRPDVSPWTLASRLLLLALSQQVPQQEGTPRTSRKRHSYVREVCDVVECTLLSHNSLLGTIEGLDTALTYCRVNLVIGNIQKTWLYLRRVIAIAELIGLPRAAKRTKARAALGTPEHPADLSKWRVWTAICTVDRLACLLNNFPIATRAYSTPIDQPVTIDGTVQPQTYLMRLSVIAIGVSDLEDLKLAQRSEQELYSAVLNLDGNLRALAASTPPGWWSNESIIGAADIIRFVHCSVAMQIHFSFVLRSDPRGQFAYSKMMGLNACRDLLYRWQRLRRDMPQGFFLCRVIDSQAFTAMVVLLLSWHGIRLGSEPNAMSAEQNHDISTIIASTMDLLRVKSAEQLGSDVARQAVASMEKLMTLLSDETHEPQSPRLSKLKLSVPLLGTIYVHRTSSNNVPSHQQVRAPEPAPQDWSTSDPHKESEISHQVHPNWQNNHTSGFPGTESQQPFSFYIDHDSEEMFQDQFLMGDLDMFDQVDYGFSHA